MTQQIDFEARNGITTFVLKGETDAGEPLTASLRRLGGLTCGYGGEPAGPPRARGLGTLTSSLGHFEADTLPLIRAEVGENTLSLVWSVADTLHWESQWTLAPATGIWRRRDALSNVSSVPVMVTRCLARIPFSPAPYQVYSQYSSWCNENQGAWQDLDHGAHQLYCRGGRTTQNSTPYLLLRDRESRQSLAFHVLPQGNWVIKAHTCVGPGDALPFVIVELGLSDERLALDLPPGSKLELPPILIQLMGTGEPEDGAPYLHSYAHAEIFDTPNRALPVVYNTWFDTFEYLDPARLERQLDAAQALGCEVFTVDAGWYGQGDGNWGQQVGDWREKQHAAFEGHMAAFADKVRAAGLDFGLWVEPERNHPSIPAVQAHPGWFLPGVPGPPEVPGPPGASGFVYPDLTQAGAYASIRSELTRLIQTYELGWMKVDFNFELGRDPTELHRYYEHWYTLLDELRGAYPGVVFEGCASGGMRSDLRTLSHFDCHFLSDTVHPVDVLRIRQGALLRLPPGKIAAWIVLRSIGETVPQYGLAPDMTPESVIAPGGATWRDSVTVDLDFAARLAMPGALGVSGDIASLSVSAIKRLQTHIAFYKRWRSLITDATAYLLTPVQPKPDRAGWAALQLRARHDDTSLVFAYRLDDGARRKWFPLRGLEDARGYTVTSDEGTALGSFTGRQLSIEGLPVELAERYNAAVFVVARDGATDSPAGETAQKESTGQ